MASEYVTVPDDVQLTTRGPLALLTGYDNEINYGVDYWYWDYSDSRW